MENNKWPELCEQLIATFDNALRDRKLTGEEMMLVLIDALGGQVIYLPRAVSFKSFVRDQQIYAEFTGNNHKELCMKYDLSEPRIYQIIQEQREYRNKREQATLDLV